MDHFVRFTHWLPIVTFCPHNGLPDLLYVSITFNDKKFRELYDIRKRMTKPFGFKKIWMEDIALMLKEIFPDASKIEVKLAFNKHRITVRNNDNYSSHRHRNNGGTS